MHAARRRRVRSGLLALLLGFLVASVHPSLAAAAPVFYVSLGDSLANGAQPDRTGHDHPTSAGYVDVVAAWLRSSHSDLQVVKLGGGGTSSSLIDGPAVNRAYGPGSQLAQAQSVLGQHPGQTTLVTVGVGDNDVERCITATRIDSACVDRGLATVARNVPAIVSGLRQAGGANLRIVGIADYDQFWAFWLRGRRGRAIAQQSAAVVGRLNRALDLAYTQAGAIAADAGPAFATQALRPTVRLTKSVAVPLAVARICAWTWACSRPPIGFDDHANAAGYRVVASAVIGAVRRAQNANPTGGTPAP
jgi:lysophospholipase L1-like esterase